MKKLLSIFLALGTVGAFAQELPQPSPKSTIQQRVGLTDFTVEYSRPAKRGREIFGSLVPYDKLWRTGANKATSIEFNTAVVINGEEVAPGKYSIFSIPSEKDWTFILNSNTELWGTDGYEEDKDVLRVNVPSIEFSAQENFTIGFNSIEGGAGALEISWDGRGISIPFTVDVTEKAKANITEALKTAKPEDQWRVHRNAATYYLRELKDAEAAKGFSEGSVKLNPDNWYSHLVHGEVLAALGDKKGALKAGKMAMKLGQEAAEKAGQEFGYASMIEEAMAEWKK